mgnify:FL=1|tara:strand:+ start:53 stop:205 length:153 start_codon:yes stop_codon:yes gene_type:complete
MVIIMTEAQLIDEFESDPNQTLADLRDKSGWSIERLIHFLSDYLKYHGGV